MKKYAVAAVFSLFILGCLYNHNSLNTNTFLTDCSRVVTVFIDKEGELDLKSQGLTIQQILKETNGRFAEQSIKVSYDVRAVKIKKWGRTIKLPKAVYWAKFAFDGEVRKESLVKETDNLVDIGKLKYSPGVILFLTNDLSIGNGFAYRFLIGNGVIVLGTALDRSVLKGENKLNQFSEILMHESAHIYGLKHVKNDQSIMSLFGDGLGIRKFDTYSKLKFQEVTGNVRCFIETQQ